MAENKSQKNIDPSELAKFEAFSAQWWDLEGDLKALHDINPLRVGYVEERSPLSGKIVIDVACGGGLLSEAMAQNGAVVTGIDAGEASLKVARNHALLSGLEIDYRQSTVEAFAESHPNRFDVVTCMELLEHVPEPASIVSSCSQLLKDGGDIFFATLNRNLKSFLFAIFGAEYFLRIVRRGTHTYRQFIKPKELQLWGKKAGLAHSDTTGLHYNPFFKRYHLGGNHHVNYLMHLKKIKKDRLNSPVY